MNKIIFTLAAVMTLSFAACGQNKGDKSMQTENKPLVVYFSATGTTAMVALTIADITGGTLYEIVPQRAYTSDDLDWNDRQSRSSVEMNNPQSRPAIKGTKADVAAYDVIFIGYPIWWDQAPRIINTFIESHDLTGKTLVPFATSGGSGISNSVKELRKAYPDLKWRDGKLTYTVVYCFTLFLQPSHEHIVLQIQITVKTIEYKSLYLHAEETKSDIRAYSCFYRV